MLFVSRTSTQVLLRELLANSVSLHLNSLKSRYLCLPFSLREFRLSTQRAASERDTEVARATRSLAFVEGTRLARAEAASLQDSVQDIRQEVDAVQRAIDQSILHPSNA